MSPAENDEPEVEDFGYSAALALQTHIQQQLPIGDKRLFRAYPPEIAWVGRQGTDPLQAWWVNVYLEDPDGKLTVEENGHAVHVKRIIRVFVVSQTLDVLLFKDGLVWEFPACNNDIRWKNLTRFFIPQLRAQLDT